MADLPPKIDRRTYSKIVKQTESLAQQFTDWEPVKGKTDAGRALIRIFATMVKSVSDRLNQVPEKNFLAFLDLIGGQLKPPQAAKVPLTFYLAEGSPVDGLVPAQTQVSAPPAEGSGEEIVFETDGELVVTTAQLQGVFVHEPSRNMYSDRTLSATGQKDEAFYAFEGDTTSQSNLIPEVCLFNSTPLDLTKDFYPFGEQPELNDTFYIALHESFIKPDAKITIDITLSHQPIDTNNLEITWEIGNGESWQEITDKANEVKWEDTTKAINFVDKTQAELQFPNKQENMPSPSTVNGETRYWIRARITKGHYGQPSKNRNYVIYNEVAIVQKIPQDKKTIHIVGNAADFFSKNDVIRLVWINENKEERAEYEIESVSGSALILKTSIKQDKKIPTIGAKIFLREINTETIPPTYDAPLVKSLKLTYLPFLSGEPTLYLGFDKSFDNKTVTLYAQVEPPSPEELSTDITLEAVLTETANKGETTLKLADITGWRKGDRIQVKQNENQHHVYIITDIPKEKENKHNIIISPPLRQNYEPETKIIRPTIPPKLVWEYSSSQGWQPLGVQDETQAFSQRGLIHFIAPADFSKKETFGKKLYWLRVRWEAGNFRVKPRLRRILTNTIWAVQATTFTEEVLGSSNHESNQVFVANNTPILMGQQLEVEEGQIPPELEADRVKVIRDDLGEIESVWVLWQEVADFYGSGADCRHYTLDRQTGEVRFGDGRAGMIPPRGRNNIRLSFYRTGGGKQGNISSETVSQLKTTIPYIDQVINLEASAGGVEQETLERLKTRVPKQLRHRDRAVTLEDIEDLAYEASTDVARVKVVTPDLITANFSSLNENFWLDPNNPDISVSDFLKEKEAIPKYDEFKQTVEKINERGGQVKLIILPYSSKHQPIPSLALLKQVETYIRSRCEPTVDLIVTAPKWQEVTVVNATISPVSLQGANMLRNTIKQSLETFLHPLTGGKDKKGWQFGRYPRKSDFYAIIQSIPGVNYVESLETEERETNSSLSADTLIYSGNHTINLKQ